MLREATQISHYRLLRWIGGGGMGDVYLAENVHLGAQVAIKVIKPVVVSNPEARRLFLREAKAAATLDHPYILPLFDYGEATVEGDIYPYMVMPVRLEGSLKAWLKQHGAAGLPMATTLSMLMQAASALQHAHDRQIIHLDVKPSNFLLRLTTGKLETPDLLLSDFGLAKIMTTEVSMSNTSRGTPPYMAPEQWRGFPVAASDQYALAAMGYELLTGRTPFLGKSPEAFMYQHLHTTPEPPSTFHPRLPKEVDEVLLHALAKSPEDRFATVAAFAHALEQALTLPESGPASLSPHILRTTVTISQDEARTGTSRSLELPGVQSVDVAIPAGVHDGQIIHISVHSKGADHAPTGPVELLVITIAIEPGQAPSAPDGQKELETRSATDNETVGLEPEPSPKKPALPPRVWLPGAVALLLVLAGVIFFVLPGPRHGPPTGPSPTATPRPTGPRPTATPPQLLYQEIIRGAPAFNDPLARNSALSQWDQTPTVMQGGTCSFLDGAYHVTQVRSRVFYRCEAEHTNYSNFVYQVQVTIQSGDEAGIIFRFDPTLQTFYCFHVSTDGVYSLDIDNRQGYVRTLSAGTTPALKIGHNQTNLLAVMAQGSHLYLFINKTYVTGVVDTSYSQGAIGVMAQDDSSPTYAYFKNAQVWLLQS